MTWLLRCFSYLCGGRTSPLQAMSRPLTLDGLSAFARLRTLRCSACSGVTAFAYTLYLVFKEPDGRFHLALSGWASASSPPTAASDCL